MQNDKKLIYADNLIHALCEDVEIDGAHFARVKRHINAAPAVDAVVHGRWVLGGERDWNMYCSVCGGSCWYYDYEQTIGESNYCPNCGAKMDGGNEDGAL